MGPVDGDGGVAMRRNAHSPVLEEPEQAHRILQHAVLAGPSVLG